MYPFGVQSSAASEPSSFQTGPSALLLKNHNVGRAVHGHFLWKELLICFFPHAVAERLEGGRHGCGKKLP